jgi:hypothetical protein
MKPRIEDIKMHVCSHIAEISTIKDIASHFQTSSDAMRIMWMRSEELMSLGKFILMTRIVAVDCWHREHPEALCKEIAAGVGLHSLDVATRCCKRVTGRTMSDYLRR